MQNLQSELQTIQGVLSVIASTDALDSHGEKVVQDFDLSRYQSNPVVLWEHGQYADVHPDLGLPIGRAENVRVENGRLLADIVLVSEAANPFVAKVKALISEDALKGVSVRFSPGEIKDGVLSKNKLQEISLTCLGSNPETVIESYKSIKKEQAMDYNENDFKNLVDQLAKLLGVADATPETLVAAVEKLTAERSDVAEAMDAKPEDNLAEVASAKMIASDEAKAAAKSAGVLSVRDAVKSIVEAAEKDGKVSPASRERTIRHGEKFGLDSLKSLVDSLPAKFPTKHTPPSEKLKSVDSFELDEKEAQEIAQRNGIDIERVKKHSQNKGVR